ncbi:DUF5376 family protein [Psychrobacter sp. FDAARGOS_221]|uniref:DUF5376 family protein n=1 Tax=Psychrobacter sp. FDAARGOS_221 TaxID=1975705 RepID=UPI000BB57006|nr:DUF5376 family protein [Psychrobacter sp. FDAARGOS_221]PNK61358.1 hypothetical protein A6J60_011100 [Psychrobacter sp. FDAARGOS_221]
MNFKFCYFKFPDSEDLNPTVCPSTTESDEESLISSYLIDSGGVSIKSHIDYLTECLRCLKDISIYNADISSNSYGVEIDGDNVKIYFLYSKNEEAIVDRFKLGKLLYAWILFLKREPKQWYEEIANID